MMVTIVLSVQNKITGAWTPYRVFGTDAAMLAWVKRNEEYFKTDAVWSTDAQGKPLIYQDYTFYTYQFVPYYADESLSTGVVVEDDLPDEAPELEKAFNKPRRFTRDTD